jgi:hypothetical protein
MMTDTLRQKSDVLGNLRNLAHLQVKKLEEKSKTLDLFDL